jgi:hypothetical protein
VSDFNPGITEAGLFWTTRLPQSSVDVDLGDATARLAVSGLDVEDYGNVVNALQDGPSEEAEVSYRVRWRHELDRFSAHDDANDFGGRFIQTEATIEWSARKPGFRFRSDPAASSTTVLAFIGRERNGVYFP